MTYDPFDIKDLSRYFLHLVLDLFLDVSVLHMYNHSKKRRLIYLLLKIYTFHALTHTHTKQKKTDAYKARIGYNYNKVVQSACFCFFIRDMYM